jgi:hypothetical protein
LIAASEQPSHNGAAQKSAAAGHEDAHD